MRKWKLFFSQINAFVYKLLTSLRELPLFYKIEKYWLLKKILAKNFDNSWSLELKIWMFVKCNTYYLNVKKEWLKVIKYID
jgi:hypothetical protein